jgi:hypothetical protein
MCSIHVVWFVSDTHCLQTTRIILNVLSLQLRAWTSLSHTSRYQLYKLFDSEQTWYCGCYDGLSVCKMYVRSLHSCCFVVLCSCNRSWHTRYTIHHGLCHGWTREAWPKVSCCASVCSSLSSPFLSLHCLFRRALSLLCLFGCVLIAGC